LAGWPAAPGPTTAGKAVRAAAPDHLPAQALTYIRLDKLEHADIEHPTGCLFPVCHNG
jgi:hypothetical protein